MFFLQSAALQLTNPVGCQSSQPFTDGIDTQLAVDLSSL